MVSQDVTKPTSVERPCRPRIVTKSVLFERSYGVPVCLTNLVRLGGIWRPRGTKSFPFGWLYGAPGWSHNPSRFECCIASQDGHRIFVGLTVIYGVQGRLQNPLWFVSYMASHDSDKLHLSLAVLRPSKMATKSLSVDRLWMVTAILFG